MPQRRAFYEEFSASVGLRDWLLPNARHEQLKTIVASILEGRRGLRILDIGCGAGVMSDYLTRYGSVSAMDLSSKAVELGELLAPSVSFHVSATPPASGPVFDLITLFDVIEHVPVVERPELLGRLRSALAPAGALLLSCPHPAHTMWMHSEQPELEQVVEEPVEVTDTLALAGELGLELTRYETYDIDRGGPQYHMFALRASRSDPWRPVRRRSLRWRLVLTANPVARVARRARLAARLVRRREVRLAAWLIPAKGRSPGRRLG